MNETRVINMQTLGALVREYRTRMQITQVEAAGLCRVGTRFLSELENGKETVQCGKVLHVLQRLGYELTVRPRGIR